MKIFVLKVLFFGVLCFGLNAWSQDTKTARSDSPWNYLSNTDMEQWVSCVTSEECKEINLRNFTSVEYAGDTIRMIIHNQTNQALSGIVHTCRRENFFSGRQCFNRSVD